MLQQLTKAVLASLLLLAPSALAQGDCATLAVSHQGTVTGGGTLSIDVDGTLPDALVLMVIGPELGSHCFPIGMEQLCLGITFPALVVPVGVADAAGDLSLAIELPAGPNAFVVGTLHFQAVAVKLDLGFGNGPGVPAFEIDVCVSNTSSVDFAQ